MIVLPSVDQGVSHRNRASCAICLTVRELSASRLIVHVAEQLVAFGTQILGAKQQAIVLNEQACQQ